MASVKQTEKRAIEMLKSIKGELPVPGLVERIDACLELLDSANKVQVINLVLFYMILFFL